MILGAVQGFLAGGQVLSHVDDDLSLAIGRGQNGASHVVILDHFPNIGDTVDAVHNRTVAVVKRTGGLQGLNSAHSHGIVVAQDSFDLITELNVPGVHDVLALVRAPVAVLDVQLLGLHSAVSSPALKQLVDGRGTVDSVLLCNVALQQHVLQHAVAVLIQLGGISGPSIVDHLGLHSTGVRPVQANVVSLLVVVQDAADQVGCAVRVDDWDIILATEIVDRLACTGVNGVDDDQIIAALGQRGGDGVRLGGLVALAVEGVDYDVILCAVVLKTFTDVGGKGVGVLIHKESDLQLLALGRSALGGALRSGGALGCRRGSSGSRGTAGGQAQDHTAGQCKANQFFHGVFSFLLVNFLRFSPAFSSVRTFLHVR